MKKTLLSLLLAFTLTLGLRAQNWHPFPANSTLIYSWQDLATNPDTFLLAVRIDSSMMEGNAMASYFMRIDRTCMLSDTVLSSCGPLQFGGGLVGTICYGRDHYFGQKMLYENGKCSFISSNQDTFILESQAQLGATWQWSQNDTATVTNIALGLVFGQSDSLKTISISNGKSIVISKTYGMVHAFTFLPFPESANDYPDLEIFGNRSLGLGRDIPSAESYQPTFDSGDRLCLREERDEGGNAYIVSYWNRNFADTIAGCPFHVLSYYEEAFEQTFIQSTSTSIYQSPTLITPNCQAPPPMDPILNLLPYETNPAGYMNSPVGTQHWIRRGQSINWRISGRMEAHCLLMDVNDTCRMQMGTYDHFGHQAYLEGVGLFVDRPGHHYPSYFVRRTYVDAYQLGSESYGTCTDLHALEVIHPAANAYTVYPNPTNDLLQIKPIAESEAFGSNLVLRDLNGKALIERHLELGGEVTQVSLKDLSKGIYLLEINNEGQSIFRQKIMKLD